MRKAVEDYKAYQLKVKDRIDAANLDARKDDPDAPIDALVREEELQEMARLKKIMREKADAYLGGKANVKYNSYTLDRKDAAQAVKNFGHAGETVTEKEMETLHRQTEFAKEETDRRLMEQQKKEQKNQQGPVAGM
jgi:hypothetical protein